VINLVYLEVSFGIQFLFIFIYLKGNSNIIGYVMSLVTYTCIVAT
jgi:hypothetical protein